MKTHAETHDFWAAQDWTKTDNEIAALVGRDRSAVYRARRVLGKPIVSPYRKWTPEQIAHIRSLRESGVTQWRIAKMFNTQQQRIAQLLNPEKHYARACVGSELFAGRMVRPDRCEDCGTPCRPEAHHEDYSKPLDVRFLCVGCHGLRGRPRRKHPQSAAA